MSLRDRQREKPIDTALILTNTPNDKRLPVS